jgi:AbrB family looped-hinge helix DNA binding protein
MDRPGAQDQGVGCEQGHADSIFAPEPRQPDAHDFLTVSPYHQVRYACDRKEFSLPTATVTSKGQITIPIEVRETLKLKAGDKVDFFETEEGTFAFKPKTGSISDLKGILQKLGYAPLGYAPSIEEMNEDILDHAAELDSATLSTSSDMEEDSAS